MPINIKSKWKEMQEEKRKQKEKETSQQLIPVLGTNNGILHISDDKLVGMIEVSAINTELMSDMELEEDLLEGYESALKEVDFPFQQLMISVPIELTDYIQSQRDILNSTDNPYRRMLLEGYIQYSEGLERSRGMMQRRRYVVMWEKLKGKGYSDYEEAKETLEMNMKHMREGLEALELETWEVNSREALHNYHVLFNYEDALDFPIERVEVPQIMGVE